MLLLFVVIFLCLLCPFFLFKFTHSSLDLPEDVLSFSSLEASLSSSELNDASIESVYILGGAQLYEQALVSPFCEKINLSVIPGDYECDTFLPPIPEQRFYMAKKTPFYAPVQEEEEEEKKEAGGGGEEEEAVPRIPPVVDGLMD